MRNLIYIIIVLAISSCTCAASYSVQGLDSAEALLQTDPAAAMEQLNGYDVAEFNDSATLARWALLYSEALVANNITAPTDTIVNIAINYYERHNIQDEARHASRLKALMQTSGNRDALASALYIQKEKEFMLYLERMKREQQVLIGLIIILIASVVIIRQRQRLRINRINNEALMAEASELRTDLTKHKSECSILESKLSAMLTNRFDIIDDLCETYYESQGTKIERKAIADKVKQQIEAIKNDSGLFAEMEQAVNECQSDMLAHFMAEYANYKPEDYKLLVFLACNLSNRTIALLLGENIDVVYKRKSRLKARIAALPLPHKDLFLSVF